MATDISIIGHEMSVPRERQIEVPESDVFIVKCGIEGDRAMARADQTRGVQWDGEGNSIVIGKQYKELLRLGIPHEVVSAPSFYRPPIVKVRRK